MLAHKIYDKILLAWDPDFSKLTPQEANALREAEQSGFLREDEIDWDHLDEMHLD